MVVELKDRASGHAAAAKSLQSCPTLCNPRDGSPPGSPIPGILQARTLEWVAISFSNTWKWKVKVKSLIHVRLLATPWTAYQATRPAYQAPLSMGFSRQEYWRGVPSPSPIWPWVGLLIHEFGVQKIALFPWNYPWLVHKVNVNKDHWEECLGGEMTGSNNPEAICSLIIWAGMVYTYLVAELNPKRTGQCG